MSLGAKKKRNVTRRHRKRKRKDSNIWGQQQIVVTGQEVCLKVKTGTGGRTAFLMGPVCKLGDKFQTGETDHFCRRH